MEVEKGQKYTRKHRQYTVTRVTTNLHASYVTVLEDGKDDTLENSIIFGKKVFLLEFKKSMKKGGKDG